MSRSLFLSHSVSLSLSLSCSLPSSLSLKNLRLSCSLPSSLSLKAKASRFTLHGGFMATLSIDKPRVLGTSQLDSHFMFHKFTRSFQVLACNPTSAKRKRQADDDLSQEQNPAKKLKREFGREMKVENNPFEADAAKAGNYTNSSHAKNGHNVNKVKSTPAPSSTDHQNSYGWKGSEIQETLDLIGGRLFKHETTKEELARLQSEVPPKLVKRLKQLLEVKAEYEDELEMADSAFLLKLLSLPNPKHNNVAKKAGEGSLMLLKGARLMVKGRELLRSAITDKEAQSD